MGWGGERLCQTRLIPRSPDGDNKVWFQLGMCRKLAFCPCQVIGRTVTIRLILSTKVLQILEEKETQEYCKGECMAKGYLGIGIGGVVD